MKERLTDLLLHIKDRFDTEFFQEHRKKIIITICVLFFLFARSCSLYRFGPSAGDDDYEFTKKNYRAVTDILSYFLEAFSDEEEGLYDIPLGQLDDLEKELALQMIKKHKGKDIEFKASFNPVNFFSEGKGDKDLKNVKAIIAKRRLLKSERRLLKQTKEKPKRKEIVKRIEKLKKEIAALEKETPITSAALKKKMDELAKVPLPKSPLKKIFGGGDDDDGPTEKDYFTHTLTFKKVGRVKPGDCGSGQCFNKYGKDYQLTKSAISNTHYFISDRVSIEPDAALGKLSLYAVEAKPTSNDFKPKFSGLRKVEIPGHTGPILGFTVYRRKKRLYLIFSNGSKLLQTSTKDEKTFTPASTLLSKGGGAADPNISKDGKLLVFAEQGKGANNWVSYVSRKSSGAPFKASRIKTIPDSVQTKGPGLFPVIIRRGGKTFVVYRSFAQMFSVEKSGSGFMPPVEVEGTLPLKYIVSYNNVITGSVAPKEKNFDIATFRVSAKKTKLTKFEDD